MIFSVLHAFILAFCLRWKTFVSTTNFSRKEVVARIINMREPRQDTSSWDYFTQFFGSSVNCYCFPFQ